MSLGLVVADVTRRLIVPHGSLLLLQQLGTVGHLSSDLFHLVIHLASVVRQGLKLGGVAFSKSSMVTLHLGTQEQ